MPLIVDASSIVSLVLPDEDRDYAKAVVRALSREAGLVPALFWFEINNLLVTNTVRRKRITSEQATEFLDQVKNLPLATAPVPDAQRLLKLAIDQGLTSYDAAYLDLAMTEQGIIATQDKKLAQAAKLCGIEVFQD